MEKNIAAGKFKATCLKLMDEVQNKNFDLIVTKRGKPIVTIQAFKDQESESGFGCMKDSATLDLEEDYPALEEMEYDEEDLNFAYPEPDKTEEALPEIEAVNENAFEELEQQSAAEYIPDNEIPLAPTPPPTHPRPEESQNLQNFALGDSSALDLETPKAAGMFGNLNAEGDAEIKKTDIRPPTPLEDLPPLPDEAREYMKKQSNDQEGN